MNEETKMTEEQMAEQQAFDKATDALNDAAETSKEADTQVSESDEWKEKAYRLAADMENLRKRTDKQVADAKDYAVSSFARELLSVADNMDRAMDALKKEEVSENGLQGMQMVADQLTNTFEKANIKKIDAMGQKMDPNLHQVVVEIPSEDADAGTVVQVMQDGYTIAGRLLRPAMVGTAKKA